jgi:flagellar motor switch protein FliM
MAAAQPIASLPVQPVVSPAHSAESAETTQTQALVRREESGAEEPVATFHPLVLGLPVELDVSIPVRGFRVRDLLTLAWGQVIEARWSSANDLPLSAGEVQLAWTEFEVMETMLAVRVTRVA